MTDNAPTQPAPDELKTRGRRLWTSLTDAYELEEHELVVLLSAARTADYLDRLADDIARAPELVVEGRKSDTTAHPALVEHRQQSAQLTRLLAALRVPAGEDEDRPQVRGGARQPYSRRADERALRAAQ